MDLAIASLEQAYASTTSKEAREQIRFKLMNLKAEATLEQLRDGERELERMVERCPPYAPEAFCLLLRPQVLR